jgi:hypothetical protein
LGKGKEMEIMRRREGEPELVLTALIPTRYLAIRERVEKRIYLRFSGKERGFGWMIWLSERNLERLSLVELRLLECLRYLHQYLRVPLPHVPASIVQPRNGNFQWLWPRSL